MKNERKWDEWKDKYKIKMEEIEEKLGRKKKGKEILIEGIIEKENMIDIIRKLVVLENIGGRRIKKMERYKKLVEVGKEIERIRKEKNNKRSGGVIKNKKG